MKKKTQNLIVTIGSLVGLLVGFVLGIVLLKTDWEAGLQLLPFFDLFGKIWVNLLILLVIPLSTSYLVYVVLSMVDTKSLGKLGGYALLVHTAIFIFGLFFSVVFAFVFVEIIGENLPSLSIPENISGNTLNAQPGNAFAIDEYISLAEEFQKFLGKTVLILLFVSVVIAFFIARFWKKGAAFLLPLSQKVSEVSMNWLQFLLLSLPVAVLALILPMVVKTGFNIVGVAGLNVIVLSVLLILFIGVIYLIVHFWGKQSISEFAKGMYSAQIVAASTRSSLATIPSLLNAAENKMGIPKAVSAVIIPFFISVFRMNRAISSPFHFILLTYVYRLEIDIPTLLFFLLVQIIISYGSPGIPSGGKLTNLPLYLAAGIPIEGYILLKAVDAIPDIFKTLLNVTEAMAVTSIVSKKANWKLEEVIIPK